MADTLLVTAFYVQLRKKNIVPFKIFHRPSNKTRRKLSIPNSNNNTVTVNILEHFTYFNTSTKYHSKVVYSTVLIYIIYKNVHYIQECSDVPLWRQYAYKRSGKLNWGGWMARSVGIRYRATPHQIVVNILWPWLHMVILRRKRTNVMVYINNPQMLVPVNS